jgi:UDP-3-O-[3-hydroxymyristoyl] glucosamine N-acyltransferase
MVGGQVGIIGHLTIGSGARIAGQSGVTRDMAPGETVMGSPAVPIRDYHRQVAVLRRLAKGKGD